MSSSNLRCIENDSYLRHFFNENPVGMYLMDTNGCFLDANKALLKLAEIEAEELIGKDFLMFCSEEDKEFIIKQFKVSVNGSKNNFEANFRTAKGNNVVLLVSLTPIVEKGKVTVIYGISKNITDIKIKARKEISEKEKKINQIDQSYRLAAMATRDLIYDWDLVNDKVKRFVDGKENIFGYPEKDFTKRDFWSTHIHPDELSSLSKQLNDTLKDPTKERIETTYRLRRANGEYADIIDRGYIIRDKSGKAVRLIGASTDISELQEKARELKRSNKVFSLAMKATKEMIWDWDLENDQLKRSKAFTEITGYRKCEVGNRGTWLEKIHPDDCQRVQKSIYKAFYNKRKKKKWKAEYRIIKKDGEIAFVIDRGYIIRNKEGLPLRVIGATLDVTESRNLLEKIKAQNEILRQVAWEQAHLVRSPLTRMQSLIPLLENQDYELWSREELFSLVTSSLEELDEVIKKLVEKTEKIEPH